MNDTQIRNTVRYVPRKYYVKSHWPLVAIMTAGVIVVAAGLWVVTH